MEKERCLEFRKISRRSYVLPPQKVWNSYQLFQIPKNNKHTSLGKGATFFSALLEKSRKILKLGFLFRSWPTPHGSLQEFQSVNSQNPKWCAFFFSLSILFKSLFWLSLWWESEKKFDKFENLTTMFIVVVLLIIHCCIWYPLCYVRSLDFKIFLLLCYEKWNH